MHSLVGVEGRLADDPAGEETLEGFSFVLVADEIARVEAAGLILVGFEGAALLGTVTGLVVDLDEDAPAGGMFSSFERALFGAGNTS